MSNLTIFNNEQFGEIRVTEIDGEPWFVGKDVAVALGYSNTKDAIVRHIDAKNKDVFKIGTQSGKQGYVIINEFGLYSLMISSRLHGIKQFADWIKSKVIVFSHNPCSCDDAEKIIADFKLLVDNMLSCESTRQLL